MRREMVSLEVSARQVSVAKNLGTLPIVSIKAASFFKPSFWTLFIPLHSANQLRDKMHMELCKLSTDCLQLDAAKSGHFVWTDQPDLITDAVRVLLDKLSTSR